MTIADLTLLIAALLPYITVAFAKRRSAKTFDNADPRNISHYDAMSMRAYSAHLNGFEIFPFFAAAVLLSELKSVPSTLLAILCVLFIAIRLFYTIAYVMDKPKFRSVLFSTGFLIVVAIFLLPFFS